MVNLAKELGMEPIKFSLSSNEVKFVKLQKKYENALEMSSPSSYVIWEMARQTKKVMYVRQNALVKVQKKMIWI